MKRVLIIGGYGNFGSFISRRLVQDDQLQLIIGGRNQSKAKMLADDLAGCVASIANPPEAVQIDIHHQLAKTLAAIRPDIVIHTSGPFQSQGYDVAQACIACGAHYIDLADGREFVAGIETLNQQALQAGVTIISGASSVPCLTSALLDSYQHEFSELDSLDYGITTAQKTTRGLATTAAILGYTGKAFSTLINGRQEDVYGWQSLHSRRYANLGRRWLGNCNVPDLELFPKRYPQLKIIRFYAGLELPFVHMTLWALSWLVRIKLVKSLEPTAPLLLKLSFLFDRLGTSSSGFHMELAGKDHAGASKKLLFELTALSGDGPYIPCMPAILLTQKLARGEVTEQGALPCVGLITKEEYLSALGELDIHWNETWDSK